MDKPRFEGLSARLPPLTFDPQADSAWGEDSEVQAYLNHYSINLTKDYPGVRHGFGRVAAAGFNLATHYWLPDRPRGTLVVVHGYYDHVGLYGHALRFGLDQGYAVLTFDLPGHGLSSGAHASIDSFDQYADALHEVLEASEPLMPRPMHCLAQSTGGATVLNYLWRYSPERPNSPERVDSPELINSHERIDSPERIKNPAGKKSPAPIEGSARFERIALCAPLILPLGWRTSFWVYWLARPWVKRVRRVFRSSSHDPSFNHFVRHGDGLQYPYLPIKWVTAMRRWDSQFFGFPPLAKPLLVVQGSGDRTVDWRYNLAQIKRRLPNVRIHMVAGAGHHLVNEAPRYRRRVFNAISQWLEGQGPDGPEPPERR